MRGVAARRPPPPALAPARPPTAGVGRQVPLLRGPSPPSPARAPRARAAASAAVPAPLPLPLAVLCPAAVAVAAAAVAVAVVIAASSGRVTAGPAGRWRLCPVHRPRLAAARSPVSPARVLAAPPRPVAARCSALRLCGGAVSGPLLRGFQPPARCGRLPSAVSARPDRPQSAGGGHAVVNVLQAGTHALLDRPGQRLHGRRLPQRALQHLTLRRRPALAPPPVSQLLRREHLPREGPRGE